MPILQGVEDSVTNSNFKYFGELGLQQVALQRDEAIGHWSAMNKAREGFMTRALRDFAEPNVQEAAADATISGSSNATDAITSALAAAIAQILSKQGNNTPPQTGTATPG